jgi:7-cyano-7-deazaguanine synthase
MKEIMMEDLVILFSGGADSNLLLQLAKAVKLNPYCILVHYGQFIEEELDFAAKQLDKMKVPYHVVSLIDLNVDSGLTGSGEKNTYKGVHERYVPGRNMMFLSIAFSIAESKGINTIWIGANYSDRENLFPDCYQEFIIKINELFKICGSKPIIVDAPLLGMTEEMVTRLLGYFRVSKGEIFSGYGDLDDEDHRNSGNSKT